MEVVLPNWIMFAAVYALGILQVAASFTEDYCHHEGFKAQCLENQVVVMTTAKYGRMKLGRCIKTDFGYIGCVADVLDQVHSRCSGRRSCNIYVPDPSFDKEKPCHEDLKMYLEVSYDCINVSIPETDSCPANSTNNITNNSGYFASVVTMETGCGNEFSPWNIIASPGQRINVTLMDFRRKSVYNTKADLVEKATSIESSEQILCKELAIVEEDDVKTALSSCDGTGVLDTGGRYTSMGHNITLYMRSRALVDQAQFIIKYEVVGCPDIEQTRFTWVTRDGDKITVGCRGTELTWHMTCMGNTWHGEPGNCSAGEIKDPAKRGDGTSVIIILVVSGVVGVIVLLIGLFCMKRYRARQAMQDMPMKDVRPLNQDDNYDQGMLYARNDAFQSGRMRIGKQKLTGKHKKGKNDHEYEYVWDMSGTTQSVAQPDNTVQTSACVVAGRGTPKSPRAPHTPPEACHCPEIHVHVHHSMENRMEGGQAQVSRVHIQARTDHSTMPRMAATICRTPTTRKRDGSEDFPGSPGTLRAIQAPPTPQRNRKGAEPSSSQKHMTMGRYKSKDSDRHRHHHHHHPHSQDQQQTSQNTESKNPEKRYWTLPVGKSAFKSSSKSATTPPDSSG